MAPSRPNDLQQTNTHSQTNTCGLRKRQADRPQQSCLKIYGVKYNVPYVQRQTAIQTALSQLYKDTAILSNQILVSILPPYTYTLHD